MGANFKVLPQRRLDPVRCPMFLHHFLILGGTRSFATFAEDDDHAAFTDGAPSVIHRLLQLIHIDILGEPATGSDHQIRFLFHFGAVYFVDHLAGFLVGLDVIAGINRQESFFLIQNNIDQERGAAHFRAFNLIMVHRIAFQLADDRVGIEHHAVIVPDRLISRNARQHRLPAAAKPGKEVVDDAPCTDDMVDFRNQFAKTDFRATGSRAKILDRTLVPTIRIIHLHPFGYGFADRFHHFLLSHGVMRSQCKYDPHVGVGNTDCIQFIHHHRQKYIASCHPGRIIDDKRDSLPRLDDFPQWRRADRVPDGL